MCSAEGLPSRSSAHLPNYSVGCTLVFGVRSAGLAAVDGVRDLHTQPAALRSRRLLVRIRLIILGNAPRRPAIGQIFEALGIGFDPQYCDSLSQVCGSA